MSLCAPTVVQQQNPSPPPAMVHYVIRGDDDPYQPHTPDVIQRNFHSSYENTLFCLDQMRSWADNWNGYGAVAPDRDAITFAQGWIALMYHDATSASSIWEEPNVVADGNGDIVLEWWKGARKLTIYISQDSAEYVKVWGPDIVSQMEDGAILNSSVRRALWRWLMGSNV